MRNFADENRQRKDLTACNLSKIMLKRSSGAAAATRQTTSARQPYRPLPVLPLRCRGTGIFLFIFSQKHLLDMAYLFTSESVSEGHPDKVADQISDAVLDQLLAFDPNSKVACETLVTTGQVVVAGEVKCGPWCAAPLPASVRPRPPISLRPKAAASSRLSMSRAQTSTAASTAPSRKSRVPATRA